MEAASKTARLCHLRQEIGETIKDSWLFPEQVPVRGFLGTGPIMFVAERPSTGQFWDPKVKLFYKVLVKLDLADSHLTDVIKSRGRVTDCYPRDLAVHKRVFDQEIQIVQPRLIVALGYKTHLLLLFSLAEKGIPILRVNHYSYRFGPSVGEKFKHQVEEAVRGFAEPHDPK